MAPTSGQLGHERYAAHMSDADGEYVDELPEDLDLSEFVGPHTFPNNNRRRIPAALYVLFGAGCLVLWVGLVDESPLVNAGTIAVPSRREGAHTEASASGVNAS